MNNHSSNSLPYMTAEDVAKFYAGELYIAYDGSSEIKELMQALHDKGFRYLNGRSQIEIQFKPDDFYVFRFIPERQAIKAYRMGDYLEWPDLPRPIPFYFLQYRYNKEKNAHNRQ